MWRTDTAPPPEIIPKKTTAKLQTTSFSYKKGFPPEGLHSEFPCLFHWLWFQDMSAYQCQSRDIWERTYLMLRLSGLILLSLLPRNPEKRLESNYFHFAWWVHLNNAQSLKNMPHCKCSNTTVRAGEILSVMLSAFCNFASQFVGCAELHSRWERWYYIPTPQPPKKIKYFRSSEAFVSTK